MGTIACTKTSVRNYHFSLCDVPEENSFHLLSGGSLKSRRKLIFTVEFQTTADYFDLLDE
jgi:hypothetical protein